jgi:acyl-CoA synthetase (AMP-forming)/AMP-acid ligase II
MQAMLSDDAQIWTPYGATECLPVAIIEGRELRATRAATESGAGTCIGRPVTPNQVRIIAIDDDAIAHWGDVRELASGEIGEITVAGPSVTDEYFNRPQATALAKVAEQLADGSTRIVHRMGDLGYFDADGRLWFCGRKSQRVRTAHCNLYTEQIEPVFNTHPDVRRTALVGIGPPTAQTAVLCVETEAKVSASSHERIEAELLNLGARHSHSTAVQRVLFHPGFPVDIRHNAKIGREKLATWAQQQLRR